MLGPELGNGASAGNGTFKSGGVDGFAAAVGVPGALADGVGTRSGGADALLAAVGVTGGATAPGVMLGGMYGTDGGTIFADAGGWNGDGAGLPLGCSGVTPSSALGAANGSL